MKTLIYPILYALLPLSHLAAAVSIDCDHIRVDGKKFDLSKLAGRHSISVHATSRPPAEYNTTWTVNLCAPLKKLDGIRDQDQCPAGTRGKTETLRFSANAMRYLCDGQAHLLTMFPIRSMRCRRILEPRRRSGEETRTSRERDPHRRKLRIQHRRQSRPQGLAIKSPRLELRWSAD